MKITNGKKGLIPGIKYKETKVIKKWLTTINTHNTTNNYLKQYKDIYHNPK